MLHRSIRMLPENVQTLLKRIRNMIRYVLHIGFKRYCPVCNMPSRKFRKAGLTSREDAQCFYCHVLKRHRFVWIYFQQMTDLFNYPPKLMLHVAPEPMFAKRLKAVLGSRYITVDRLHAAGFNAQPLHSSDFFTEDQCVRIGISHGVEGIYYCTKR
jgi:hypothetical protein